MQHSPKPRRFCAHKHLKMLDFAIILIEMIILIDKTINY